MVFMAIPPSTRLKRSLGVAQPLARRCDGDHKAAFFRWTMCQRLSPRDRGGGGWWDDLRGFSFSEIQGQRMAFHGPIGPCGSLTMPRNGQS